MSKSIRSVFIATGAVAVLGAASGAAQAADMPTYTPPPIVEVAPIAEWTGFYVGLHAGYGWGDADGSTSQLPNPAAFGALPFSTSTDIDGFIGGAQAGFNWQFDRFVAGLEADISYSDMNGGHLVTPLLAFGGLAVPGWYQQGNGDIDWFGTVRARAGFLATPQTLIYATGGFAFANTKFSTLTQYSPVPNPTFTYGGSADETNTGWTVGAGVEWSFAPNWTVKAEYLYFDLDDIDYVAFPLAPNPPFALAQSFENNGSIVRLGINYKFSWY